MERPSTLSFWLTGILPAAFVILILARRILRSRSHTRSARKETDESRLPAWAFIFKEYVTTEHIEELEAEEAEERERERIAAGEEHAVLSDTNGGRGESQPLLGNGKDASKPLKIVRPKLLTTLGLTLVGLMESFAWLAYLAYSLVEGRHGHGDVLQALLGVISWSYAALCPLLRPTITPPSDLFLLYSLHFLGAVIEAYGLVADRIFRHQSTPVLGAVVTTFNIVLCIAGLALVFSMPLEKRIRPTGRNADGYLSAPDDYVTLWEWLSFRWINELIEKGSSTTLEDKDVYAVPSPLRSRLLLKRFFVVSPAEKPSEPSASTSTYGATNGNGEVPHKDIPKKPSLVYRLFRANAHDLVLDLVLTVIAAVLSYAPPFFLKRILDAIDASTQSVPSAPPQSIFSKATLHALVGGGAATRESAYLFAIFAFLCTLIKSQIDLQRLCFSRRAATRVRAELVMLIYDKALRKKDIRGALATPDGAAATKDDSKKKPEKQESEAAADVGKVVSLMAVDAQRSGQACASLYMLYSSPIEIVIATTFLLSLLGPSALVGYVCIMIATPAQAVLARRAIRLSKSMSAARDKRMSILSEVIAGLKFLKYFGTLMQWRERVMAARERELGWILKRQINSAWTTAVWIATPALFTAACFGSYTVLFGHELDAATGFTAIALFGLLRGPLALLPMMITDLLNTHVAIKRIEAFLDEDEVPQWVCTSRKEARPPATASFDRRIVVDGATFRWRKNAAPPDVLAGKAAPKASLLSRVAQRLHLAKAAPPAVTSAQNGEETLANADTADEINKPFELRNISISPPVGNMTLVAGPTGCGKSTLLASLLGEVDLIEGTLQTPKFPFNIEPQSGLLGSIAYCAQQPWLLQASIKDNIVFGSDFDEKRYADVLECCALKPDLEILVDGDRTEIGERGVSLSGGQKARVALARAVYSRSATVLMDDVLAAVDSHTAEKITRECLNGPLMQGRTVLLVTHHVNLVLPGCAWVILLDQGELTAEGTVEDLRQTGKLDTLATIVKEEIQEEVAEEEAMKDDAEVAAAKAPGLEGETDEVKLASEVAAAKNTPAPATKLIKAEKKETGAVKWSVYGLWLKSASYWFAAATVLLLVLYKLNDLLEKFWLSFWTSSYSNTSTTVIQPVVHFRRLLHPDGFSPLSVVPSVSLIRDGLPAYARWGFPPANENVLPYMLGFIAIQLFSLVIWLGVAVFGFLGGIRAGRILFGKMLDSVLRSTSRWLDQTPSGRSLSKFTRDVDTVDQSLHSSLRQVLTGIINLVVSVAVVTWVLPGFSVIAIIMGVVYFQLAKGYIACGRDLRRIESVTRSPIFSSFGELLDGIMTVRAYSQETRFLGITENRLDRTSSAYWYTWMTSRWLLFRFDCIGAACVLTASVLALSGSIPAGLAGIAITQSQALTMSVYWLSRFWTQLEQDGNSVERVAEMINDVPQEAPAIVESARPPALWPSEGGIEINDLEIRYAPELTAVLHGISLSIRPREKIGVVGRTGSGKSTLALAFFRFVEFSRGSIVIDGINVSKMGLDDLRSRLVIIPQDAVLFTGTIRDNLDPFNEHTDEECIHVLRQVQLYSTPTHSRLVSRRDSLVEGAEAAAPAEPLLAPAAAAAEEDPSESTAVASGTATPRPQQSSLTLDTVVADAGGNFSAGQRQLLAVARAMLRKSRVVICDEMSSAIDFHTDTILQRTMTEAFEDSTVLTIAHRLSTVASTSDRVLVLDRGNVVEFDSPHTLLSDEGSVFYGMCKKSGELESLRKAAAETAQKRGN